MSELIAVGVCAALGYNERMPESSVDSSAAPGRFVATSWSVIAAAQAGSAEARREALERLTRIYWRPVHTTLRFEWNLTSEDARDLTQEYFAEVVGGRILCGVSPDKGRFRSYVKATLRNFMLRRRREREALKRGGGRTIVDVAAVASTDGALRSRGDDPARRFERELMRAMLAAALRQLKTDLDAEGRSDDYRLFLDAYGDPERPPAYAALTRSFGLTRHQVKNRLARTRLRFRAIVTALLRDGVREEEDVLAELREIFAS